ncbi:hypothetical protein [Clostridium sp. C105KSO13]|uniref:hypothetical protein n=1 Tax=Clostridium sp. C105KSO13 TaxID=1776045 RepID=UPI0007406BF7|nr:hypothetical protein [Clostridium sp. C105KSO13]CUX18456.1 hypothetical protein BN3456_00285 [Clostridium sp. C105KSO13]
MDTKITFSGFATTPYIFLTFSAGSQNTKYLGLAHFNESKTGATVRVTNAGTAGYSTLIDWMAVL